MDNRHLLHDAIADDRHALLARSYSGRLLLRCAGLILLALTLPPFLDFPVFGHWLIPGAILYLGVLVLLPRFWLVALPVATVLLDASSWTGRFIFNEYDLLFLVTLASGLLCGRCRFSLPLSRLAVLALAGYLLVVALGYSQWQVFFSPPRGITENPYYSALYPYKVFKGMIWGLTLVPMWAYLVRLDRQSAIDALVTGMSLAAVALGLVILWERGTLGIVLDWQPWYRVVKSLLDLTSSYRVTGIFSDMHTGGEALDGVVLLLLPASLYASIYGRSASIRLLGIAGFLALAYVCLVGFTRATYVAFALGPGIFAALAVYYRRQAGRRIDIPSAWLGATLVTAVIAAVASFRLAGSYGLACFAGIMFLAYAASYFANSRTSAGLAGASAMAVMGLAARAHFNSRWVEPSWPAVALLLALLAMVFLVAMRLFRDSLRGQTSNRLVLLSACLLLPVLAAFATGGHQMKDRLDRVSSDLGTRVAHWGDVVSSHGAGTRRLFLGNGIGTFPLRYIQSHPEDVRRVGSYSVDVGRQGAVLRLGGGQDLALGQRVPIAPGTLYTVSVRFRAEQKGRLVVALCERNLIYASEFSPPCVVGKIRTLGGKVFEDAALQLDSAAIGTGGVLDRWPTVFSLEDVNMGNVVEIEAVTLSVGGFNLLENGDFTHGLDYWFSYNDYAHLPWHVKNMFLQVWYESGWLGLALFLWLVLLLVWIALEPAAVIPGGASEPREDPVILVFFPGVLTLCSFGLLGSPLDSARVAWLFYFYLVAGLTRFDPLPMARQA